MGYISYLFIFHNLKVTKETIFKSTKPVFFKRGITVN